VRADEPEFHAGLIGSFFAGAPIVVLDRSPLTLIAHEHGMAAIGVPSDPAHAAEIYSTAAEAGQILTPDGYLYLAIPGNVTAARQAQRGPVAAHLMDQQARTAIDHACRAWLAALPKGCYLELDGTTTPPELTATAIRWLNGIASGSPLPPWRVMAPSPNRAVGGMTGHRG
jgi:hypothetical protein